MTSNEQHDVYVAAHAAAKQAHAAAYDRIYAVRDKELADADAVFCKAIAAAAARDAAEEPTAEPSAADLRAELDALRAEVAWTLTALRTRGSTNCATLSDGVGALLMSCQMARAGQASAAADERAEIVRLLWAADWHAAATIVRARGAP